MQNNDDDNELEDAGASADLPDETALADFLEKIQATLARQGWELRGTCSAKAVSEALGDQVNEILFAKIPGREDEFYYFNRLEGWEATDSFREKDKEESFLELAREDLANEDWEYQRVFTEASFLNSLGEGVTEVLAIRFPKERMKFYVFYRVEET